MDGAEEAVGDVGLAVVTAAFSCVSVTTETFFAVKAPEASFQRL
jgi:hypothetical protein